MKILEALFIKSMMKQEISRNNVWGSLTRDCQLFTLSASTAATPLSPLPSSYRQAPKDPNWHAAMLDEFNALIQNDT
jgi:hypothetical protein